MGERDRELDDIFAGIGDLLAGKPVIAPIAKDRFDPDIDEVEKKKKRVFSELFLVAYCSYVNVDDDPKIVAPFLKQNFAAKLNRTVVSLKRAGKHEEADVLGKSTLEDLADAAVNQIDCLEHDIVRYKNPDEREMIEIIIRKHEIIQMAAREAMQLKD